MGPQARQEGSVPLEGTARALRSSGAGVYRPVEFPDCLSCAGGVGRWCQQFRSPRCAESYFLSSAAGLAALHLSSDARRFPTCQEGLARLIFGSPAHLSNPDSTELLSRIRRRKSGMRLEPRRETDAATSAK